MSKAGLLVTISELVIELFAGFGSEVWDETLITLVAGPTACALTSTDTFALARFVMVPKLQVRTPLMFVQAPLVLVAEIRVTLVGSTSVTKTSEAGFGPTLVTDIA